ncbi:MAG: protease complex subunit PrcB family protein [Limnochordia bacterium]|jgi:NAD/NADP transhydrogenase beta subunit|nr:protease complex subunit PrcB family protein [Limnochordia bacterium]
MNKGLIIVGVVIAMVIGFMADRKIELCEVGSIGALTSTYTVITSQDQLQSLWPAFWNPGTPPQVDFDREVLIGAFLGKCSTGGYSIKIEKVTKRKGQLIVHTKIQRPGPEDIVIMVITYPGHVVSIPKKALDGANAVIFLDQNQRILGEVPLTK